MTNARYSVINTIVIDFFVRDPLGFAGILACIGGEPLTLHTLVKFVFKVADSIGFALMGGNCVPALFCI